MVWFLPVLLAGAAKPPEQTQAQKELLSKWSSRAQKLSSDATPQLKAILDKSDFRDGIKDIHEFKNKSAAELLDWYVSSIKRLDVIMTFPFIQSWGNMTKYEHVWNKWQLQMAYGLFNGPNKGKLELTEFTETKLQDFTPISDVLHPTEDQANTRPVYLSVNLWKKRNGNPMYGDTTFVLLPTWKKNLLLAPSDTGWWYKACVEKKPDPSDPPVDCSTYPINNAMGTIDYFNHIVLAHNNFQKYPWAHNFRRLYNDSYEKANPAYNWYYESDLLAAMWVPEHVWYTIANFSMFGDESSGKVLQTFHITNKKPMVWTGDTDHAFLDPHVDNFGGYNATADEKKQFLDVWEHMKTHKETFFEVYLHNISRNLHLYMLREEDCGRSECGPHCFWMGTNSNGHCIYSGTK